MQIKPDDFIVNQGAKALIAKIASPIVNIHKERCSREEAIRRLKEFAPAKSAKKVSSDKIDFSFHLERGEVLENIAKTLSDTGEFFLHDGELVRIDDLGRETVEQSNLPGLLWDYNIEYAAVSDKSTSFYHLSPQSAQALLSGKKKIRGYFPEIVHYTTSPVYSSDWSLVKPGYNARDKIYYAGPQIEPKQSPDTINSILNTFLFKDDISRTNYLALWLTMLCPNNYKGRKPFAALTGNRPGLGKTYAAQAISIIFENQPLDDITYNQNQEELEKQVASRVRFRIVISIDNAKPDRPISSAVLERFITTPRISFRLLGTSNTISLPNYFLLVITANNALFSPDLITRSLPIEFYLDDWKDPSDYFKNHRILDDLYKIREIILGELCGMVEIWKSKGSPLCKKPFRFPVWSEEIGGILEANGYNNFLDNLESASNKYDKISQDLGLLFEGILGAPKEARELATICAGDGLFTQDLAYAARPATVISNIMGKYVRKPLPLPEGGKFVIEDGFNPSTKTKNYTAKRLADPSEPGTAGTPRDRPQSNTRPVTICSQKLNLDIPDTPGIETAPEKNWGDERTPQQNTPSAGAGADKQGNEPGVPGSSGNNLFLQLKSSRVDPKDQSPYEPGPEKAYPPHASDESKESPANPLEWI